MEEKKAQKDAYKISNLIHRHLNYSLLSFYPVSTKDLIEKRPKYVAEAERLVKKYKDLRHKNGDSLLSLAIHKQNEDFVRLCLKWGCGASDIKESDQKLGYDAVNFGNLKMTELLHETGFDFGKIIKDPHYMDEKTNYLAMALNRGYIDTAEFLYKNYPDLLHSANSKGEKISILRLVLADDPRDKMESLKFLKKLALSFPTRETSLGAT